MERQSVDDWPVGAECPTCPVQQKSMGGRWRLHALFATGKTMMGQTVRVCGWSRSVRKQGGGQFCFVVLTDGSTNTTLQVVVQSGMPNYDQLLKCGTGCSFLFEGEIVESPAAGQQIELRVNDPSKHKFIIYGECPAGQYPLAKKSHSPEFLREIAHLRPRTFLIGAIARVRSQMAMAVHSFFQNRGFLYVHTPLITAADCEGAGEMFQVTTIMGDKKSDIPTVVPIPPKKGKAPASTDTTPTDEIDYKKEFFGTKAFLTVSGQLALENYACALCDTYTFGPTFRAENSHTSRHLAEFWMIEPEMAFCDIYGNMACAEAFIKYCIEWALKNCKTDLEWFDNYEKTSATGDKETDGEKSLIERLEHVIAQEFARCSYTEAISILEEAEKKGKKFQVAVSWGMDMGAEHERYLTEEVFKKPTIVYNYPSDLKAFYMRQNEDGKTTAAMDVLLPKIGEVIGGSQREERMDILEKMIEKKGLPQEPYWWYKELRKYGTVPHSGFGLGFERLIMLITGVENIRDVIPFPRYPGHAEF